MNLNGSRNYIVRKANEYNTIKQLWMQKIWI